MTRPHQDNKKYLIVFPAWLGDAVMAHSLLLAIKKQYPHCIIDVVTSSALQPLLQYMPQIRKGFILDIKHGVLGLKKRRLLGKSLRREKYTNGIVLPNSFKSALILFWANIPIRTGWHGECRYGVLNDRRILHKKAYTLMLQRFIALAFLHDKGVPQEILSPSLIVPEAKTQAAYTKYHLSKTNSIIGLCPGAAFGPSKQWPGIYHALIAEKLIQKGWQVCLFGSPEDQPIGQEIWNNIPEELQKKCFNFIGKTSLNEVIHLLTCMTVVVSNDSGLMHISAALNRPTVVMYGSTPSDHTPPFCDNFSILNAQVACSPCYKRTCVYGHHDCMNNIKPTQALDAIMSCIPTKKIKTKLI